MSCRRRLSVSDFHGKAWESDASFTLQSCVSNLVRPSFPPAQKEHYAHLRCVPTRASLNKNCKQVIYGIINMYSLGRVQSVHFFGRKKRILNRDSTHQKQSNCYKKQPMLIPESLMPLLIPMDSLLQSLSRVTSFNWHYMDDQ